MRNFETLSGFLIKHNTSFKENARPQKNSSSISFFSSVFIHEVDFEGRNKNLSFSHYIDLFLCDLVDLNKVSTQSYFAFSSQQQSCFDDLLKSQKLLSSDLDQGIGSVQTKSLFSDCMLNFKDGQIFFSNAQESERLYLNMLLFMNDIDNRVVIKNNNYAQQLNRLRWEPQDHSLEFEGARFIVTSLIYSLFDGQVRSIDSSGTHTQAHRFCKMTRQNQKKGLLPFVIEASDIEDNLDIHLITFCFSKVLKSSFNDRR